MAGASRATVTASLFRRPPLRALPNNTPSLSTRRAGEFVSLGWHEQHDVVAVAEHLRAHGRAGAIALWGQCHTLFLHACPVGDVMFTVGSW